MTLPRIFFNIRCWISHSRYLEGGSGYLLPMLHKYVEAGTASMRSCTCGKSSRLNRKQDSTSGRVLPLRLSTLSSSRLGPDPAVDSTVNTNMDPCPCRILILPPPGAPIKSSPFSSFVPCLSDVKRILQAQALQIRSSYLLIMPLRETLEC